MASWLDPDDYYRYSRAFRKWLSDTHDRMITEMPSDEARVLFAGEFAPLWNEGRLGDAYYEMMSERRPSQIDKPALDREAIRKRAMTDEADEEVARQRAKQLHKAEVKQFERTRQAVLEELVPKKEGRAAEIEKRRERSAYTRFEKDTEAEVEAFDGAGSFASEVQRYKAKQDERAIREERKSIQRQAEWATKKERMEQREREVQAMFKEMLKKRTARQQ